MDIMDIRELQEAIDEIPTLDDYAKHARVQLAIEQLTYHIMEVAEEAYPGIQVTVTKLLALQRKLASTGVRA